MSHDGYFLGVAGILTEEFRVERALGEAGLWSPVDYRDSVSGTLEAFGKELSDAVESRSAEDPIESTAVAVLSAFSTLTTLGAYLAAETIASDGERAPDTTLPLWWRYVGDAWPTLPDALRPISSAAQRQPQAGLEDLVESVAAACEKWLEIAGFTLTDLPGGRYYFDILTSEFPEE